LDKTVGKPQEDFPVWELDISCKTGGALFLWH